MYREKSRVFTIPANGDGGISGKPVNAESFLEKKCPGE